MAKVTELKQQTETEIAVLQIQVQNLDEKIEDIKQEIKDVRKSIEDSANATNNILKGFQSINQAAHDSLSKKISSIEKWRWMLIGGSIVVGGILGGVGSDIIVKLLN